MLNPRQRQLEQSPKTVLPYRSDRSFQTPLFGVFCVLGLGGCFVPEEDISADGENNRTQIESSSEGGEEGSNPDFETSDSSESTGRSCVDPVDDCPRPSSPCQEAYCTENDTCDNRPVRDETPVSEWGEFSECTYEHLCSEAGTRSRKRDICLNGEVVQDIDLDSEACARTTDDQVVEIGEYEKNSDNAPADAPICSARSIDGCTELKYRKDILCEDGLAQESDWIAEPCQADWPWACGECGNGLVEIENNELCDPNADNAAGDFCNGECKWVVYVDDSATGNNDGTSWKNAFTNLQDGIDQAYTRNNNSQPTEVWVAQGTYKAKGVRKGFEISGSMSIYGGFAGNELTLDQRGSVDPSLTILSGDLNGDDGPDFTNRSDNSYHVVSISGEGRTTIDGFTITGGYADGSGEASYGGGIYSSSDLLLDHLIVEDNYSSYIGGGIVLAKDSTSSVNSTIEVSRNHSRFGGGLFIWNESKLSVHGEIVFSENAGDESGGGFRLSGSTLEVVAGGQVILQHNKSLSPTPGEGFGAGFTAHGSTVRVTGAGSKIEIKNNISRRGGGGFRTTAHTNDVKVGKVIVENGGEIYLEGNTTTQGDGGGFVNDKDCSVVQQTGGLIHGINNTSEIGVYHGYYAFEELDTDFDVGNRPNYNAGTVID